MHIMTKDGWKQLSPQAITPAGHTPSLLEREGIDAKYDGVKAMAAYASAFGNGVYFTYQPNGVCYQSKPAIHPLRGMF
jgi:hypothetical protein